MFLDEMPGQFRYPVPEDAEDKTLLADIQRKGWHHFAVPGGDGQPGYTFSVGHFLNLNHPELIVVGLKDSLASRLLDSAAVRIRGLNKPYQPYRLYNDIADGLEVMFLPVSFPHYKEYLGFANWFYQSLPAPYPALQMVWPDPKGIFPWQPGYDARFHRAQPLLGPAPASPLTQNRR
ncbi:MAG: DUF4262 domain-containing protein [Pseudomonadota bacterium]|nr:DUF4262 domain-containing protein [Pseudomonadota bacterium]